MSQIGESFFTSIGCMDGRVQEPVLRFGQQRFGARFADTITEAGLVGFLARLQMSEHSDGGQAKHSIDENLLTSIKNKINISLQKHHSRGIVVHGHQECAGNPVDDEKHKRDVLAAAKLIRSLFPGEEVTPVFVQRQNGNWVAKEIPHEIF